jgi:hypothetical protein
MPFSKRNLFPALARALVDERHVKAGLQHRLGAQKLTQGRHRDVRGAEVFRVRLDRDSGPRAFGLLAALQRLDHVAA